jgi:hypothetical protein
VQTGAAHQPIGSTEQPLTGCQGQPNTLQLAAGTALLHTPRQLLQPPLHSQSLIALVAPHLSLYALPPLLVGVGHRCKSNCSRGEASEARTAADSPTQFYKGPQGCQEALLKQTPLITETRKTCNPAMRKRGAASAPSRCSMAAQHAAADANARWEDSA